MKAKTAKNDDFRKKMAMTRSFCGRNCGSWVRVAENFSARTKNIQKGFQKEIHETRPIWRLYSHAKAEKTLIFDQKWPFCPI